MAPHSGGAGHPPERFFRFGDVEVDAAGHGLTRAGTAQQVEPKAFAVLLALLERPGELVPRDELLDRVWGHRHVTPGVLTRAIAQLRAALGDDPQHPRYIQTRHALGYAFIGELEPPRAGRRRGDGIAGPGPDPTADPPSGEGGGEATGAAAAADVLLTAVAGPDAVGPGGRAGTRPAVAGWALMVVAGAVAAAWLLWGGSRGGPVRPAEASIAVMPFVNLGPERDRDYFAEGLAEEMHDALAGIQGLKVAAPISPAAAARLDADVRKLGALLGVATVLNASVRHDGHRVRITTRLSDCATGFTLWSESYDRELSDIFDTQEEIAAEVVQALMGVMPGHRETLARRLRPTRSTIAFDAYLRGLQQMRLGAGEGGSVDSAIDWFDRALEEDSGFFQAQAGICRSQLVRFSADRDVQAFENARTACALARDMAPGSAEVDLALGDLYRVSGDHEQAMAHYAKARRDHAQAPAALVGMAQLHAARGEHRHAAEYFRQALELSPGEPTIHGFLGLERYQAGDLDGAIAAFQRSVELDPDNADLWSSLGGVYLAAGKNREAAVAFERSLAIRPTAAVLSNYAEIRKQQKDYAAAVTLLRRALELEPSHPVFWGNLGDALQGDPLTASQAPDAYARAARLAGEFLAISPDDPIMTAARGWYLANSGERRQALEMVERARRLGTGSAEVGLLNAMTMAAVDDHAAAREWIEMARGAGMPESRIRAEPILMEVLQGTAGEHPEDGT